MAAEVIIVGSFVDNISGGLSNIANIAFDAFQAVVNSASESEQAVARLDGVLAATGGAAGLSSEQLQQMADSLQGVTRFSDETILAGESMLLTFRNIGGETFERTVPAMLDMAEIFGSVDSAAMQLGKALNDPVAGMGALSRAGITFSEDQKAAIKAFMDTNDIASAQNIILTEVENQVKGLAETMGNTFAGQMEIFNNKFDTVKETIGGAFLPILMDLMNVVEAMIPRIQIFAGAFAEAMKTGDFSVLFATFEDGSSYLGGFIEMLGIGEEKAYAFANAIFGAFQGNIAPLGEMFTDWTASIDWEKISQDIAAGIDSVDWGMVGNKISEVLGYLAIGIGNILANIDWPALLNSFVNGFLDLIGGLFGFVDWEDMWNSAMVGFRYIGQGIVDGLKAGLQANWNSFLNIISFGWDDVLRLVKNKLGIASPSAVFYNIAGDIINGLIAGWDAFWGDLMAVAQNSLDDFLNIFGIDLFGGGTGTTGGGTSTYTGSTRGTGETTGGTSGQTVINIYGVSYWGVGGPGDVDCVSPHPLVASSGNQLVTTGF